MSFVGSKGGEGVYQRIISWIPPHDVYIEPFAGLAAVWRHKRPARRSILIDLDPGALDQIGEDAGELGVVETIVGDGVEYLRRMRPNGERVFVYCDPPYLRSARRDGERDYYRHDWTLDDHQAFLDLVVELPCSVLVSGYWSKLYAARLAGWSTDHFPTGTRGGPAEEWLWANYPRPDELHDYRYLGATWPERWRIRKRQRNWMRALSRMPALERRAMLAAIVEGYGEDVAALEGASPDRSRKTS